MLIVNRNGVDYFQCQGYFGDMVEIPISDIDYFGIGSLGWDHSDSYPCLVTVVYTLPTGMYCLYPTYVDIINFFERNGYHIDNGDVSKIGGDK